MTVLPSGASSENGPPIAIEPRPPPSPPPDQSPVTNTSTPAITRNARMPISRFLVAFMDSSARERPRERIEVRSDGPPDRAGAAARSRRGTRRGSAPAEGSDGAAATGSLWSRKQARRAASRWALPSGRVVGEFLERRRARMAGRLPGRVGVLLVRIGVRRGEQRCHGDRPATASNRRDRQRNKLARRS